MKAKLIAIALGVALGVANPLRADERPLSPTTPATLSADEIREIAKDAYVYAYALLLMDATRQQLTNFETPPGTLYGPANQFNSLREFPDPSFKTVVFPNADTLYSVGSPCPRPTGISCCRC